MKPTIIAIIAIAALVLVACGGAQPEESTAPTTDPAAATDPTPAAASEVAPLSEAPAFTLPDLDSNQVELASFRGKIVVLEWFNPGCPFVKFAHSGGPLKDMATTQTARGVVWLAINSSGPGKQGHGLSTNRSAVSGWSMKHPVLIDESGEVGKAYGATSTPAMVVIDAEGGIAYKGALDNAPLGKVEGDPQNYVADAIDALLAGKRPATTETQSYGCSVKYASN